MAILEALLSSLLILSSAVNGIEFKNITLPCKEDHRDEYGSTFSLAVSFTEEFCEKDEKVSECPTLLYAGGEGDLSDFVANTGFLYKVAEETHSRLVYAEHRFYGKSMLDVDDDNYSLLDSQQAMADFKQVADHFNGSKNVVIGGSYGGMLAAWLRVTYPKTFVGALASSASVLYMWPDEYRMTDLYQIVANDFFACKEEVHSAFSDLLNLSKTNQFGAIQQQLNLCHPLKNQIQSNNTIALLQQSLTNLAQLDYPYPTDFLYSLPGNPVDVACEMFAAAGGGIDGLVEAASLTLGKDDCISVNLDHWHAFAPGLIDGPWGYQRCTELVMPASVAPGGVFLSCEEMDQNCFTSGHESQKEYCAAMYRVEELFPDETVQQLHGNAVTFNDTGNIIFTYGDLDIWSGSGVMKASNEYDNFEVFWIEGGAHHLDLRGDNDADPQSVRDVREKSMNIIKKWIKE